MLTIKSRFRPSFALPVAVIELPAVAISKRSMVSPLADASRRDDAVSGVPSIEVARVSIVKAVVPRGVWLSLPAIVRGPRLNEDNAKLENTVVRRSGVCTKTEKLALRFANAIDELRERLFALAALGAKLCGLSSPSSALLATNSVVNSASKFDVSPTVVRRVLNRNSAASSRRSTICSLK